MFVSSGVWECLVKITKNQHVFPFYSIDREGNLNYMHGQCKVENKLKDSLNSIPSPSPSVKIQSMGGKVCLRWKGKTLLGIVNKVSKTKSLLTSHTNVLPYDLK